MLAEKLHNDLIKDGILKTKGSIKFELLNTKTTVKTRSVVGDVIQDWLEKYIQVKNYSYKPPAHSQQFPDFFLTGDGEGSEREELLEIKCFDGDRSANFDVANFEAYCQSLLNNPERLDSYYLIFSYSMDDDTSEISIKNIWLKRVWEITGPSEDWPVKFQIKKGVIYNIRPITWHSSRSKHKSFQSRLEFLVALHTCIKRYPGTNHLFKEKWLDKIKLGYKSRTGRDL